jgi:sarcosine oxidase
MAGSVRRNIDPVVYDVAIVGLGAMGSSCAYALSRRGRRVIAFDSYRPPHARGSTHGETRIIREAYFENPVYVPMIQRAYELWHELEGRTGRTLLIPTGGLMLGHADSTVVSGALASAAAFNLKHEVLSAPDIMRRYPAFRLPDDFVGVFEDRAGVLLPERCVDSYLALASEQGATLVFDEGVRDWDVGDGIVRLNTANGRYQAAQVVVSSGSWVASLVDMPVSTRVERNVMHWFTPPADALSFGVGELPIFVIEDRDGRFFYGVPEVPAAGRGVKFAKHHSGDVTGPDDVQKPVSEQEIAEICSSVGRYLPDLETAWLRSTACLYTNTQDSHFVIDRHPSVAQAWIVSPCSGHGFKFASVIGEVIADLVTTDNTRFDIRPFRLGGRN